MLTVGVDQGAAFAGTSGNDTFLADYDVVNKAYTLGTLDVINGGAGVDTLKITSDNSANEYEMAAATIGGIEKIEIRGSAKVTADVSGSNVTGLETISVLQGASAVVTAADSTDIAVSGIAAEGAITTAGGNNVTIDAANQVGKITIGQTGTDGNFAVGAISVTAAKQGEGAAIDIDGGTTVTVNATHGDDSSAIKIGLNKTATGAVSVTQNLNGDGTETDGIAGGAITVTGGSSVTITSNLTINAKDEASKNGGAFGTVTVTGDGKTEAVTVTQNYSETEFTKAAVAVVKAANSVTYGDVVIDDDADAAIKTITLNGFKSATLGGSVSLDALTTLSLANSEGNTTLTTAATALDLSVNNVTDAVSIDGGSATIKTLNVTATGKNSDFALTAAAVEALAVSGDKSVDLTDSTLTKLKTVTVSGSAGLTIDASGANVTAVNTTATTGTVTATVDASKATYTGGAGVDNVTLSSSTVSKAVSTGAGDEKVTLASGTTTLGALIDGGTGTDTLKMDAANAATASQTSTFATKFTGFEKLELNAYTGLNTVDLSNMNNISHVVSANGTAGAGASSTWAGVGSMLTGGDTITFTYNGTPKKVTIGAIAGASATAAEVQTLVDAAVGASKITVAIAAGDLSFTTVSLTDTLVGGTYTDAGGSPVTVDGADTAGTAYSTKWVGGVTALSKGEKIVFTYDGVVYEATVSVAAGNGVGPVTDAELGTAIDNAVDTATGSVPLGAGKVTATLTNADADITFTAVAADKTLTGGALDAAGHNFAATDTAGTAAYSVYASQVANLTKGDTIAFTYDGTVYTATIGTTAGAVATAAEVNAAIDAAVTGAAVALGANKVTATFTNSGADLTLTSDNAAKSLVGGNFTDVGGTYATTTATDAATGVLTLNKMANNGTLELTDAGGGAIVNLTDATGTADSFNIVTKVNAAPLNFGTVNVGGVETINIQATDTSPATISKATLALFDSAAKTVNVTGESDLDLSLAGALGVTKVDASAFTGKLGLTATGTDAMTVLGGTAADTLTASGSGDVLQGGAGNDILTGASLTTLTGGAGNDIFKFVAPTNVNSYSTITDLAAGDVIDLDAANAGTVVFTKSAITLAGTAVFQDYANAAVNALGTDGDDAAWFQLGGNTYIVQSGDTTAGNDFQNGVDLTIQIVGLVDLSTASYNQSNGTLEIA